MENPRHPYVVDIGVGILVVGSLANYMPAVAATFGAVWYGIQVWESKTMAGVRKRLRDWLYRNGPV